MTEGPPDSRLRPISGALLAGCAVAGLAGGRLLHPLMVGLGRPAPVVTWPQALALVLVAALLGLVAWHTWRTNHVHQLPLEPHRAVNRLVLARACAVVGALAAGGYLGYGVSWLGDPSPIADQRVLRSWVAAAGGAAVVVASLLLERACRVRSEGEEP